jgi:tRNA-splicing ligase RtcB
MHLALEQLGGLTGRMLGFDDTRYVNNHHNYAALERHGDRELWITRKGAISARSGQLGVIPGSMGTGSYVVRGLGNPAAYQSAAHGAGRLMSRTKARKTFNLDDIERAMEGRTWQRSAAKQLIDEIPGAYKDLDQVMAYQHDLVEVVTHLRTLVNYKGT